MMIKIKKMIFCYFYKLLIMTYYKLRDWIPLKKLNWDYLSFNPNAIELLEKNQDNINWNFLSQNPNAIELLKKNPNKIIWYYLSSNPNAIEFLKKIKIKYIGLIYLKIQMQLNYYLKI